MKHLNLTKNDDITAVPSDELNRVTISAMRAKQAETDKAAYESVTKELPLERIAENERVKKVRLKKIITCAAAACAAVFLMGMGVRVFEYLTYVPGMGIVTAEQEEVYTLESVVEAGEYRIEAMSIIPITEGEYKGMWWVNVVTDMEIPEKYEIMPEKYEPMYITGSDGKTYELKCSGGSNLGAKYKGIANIGGGAGNYTLSWFGEEYTASLKSMENSVWANYEYPVHQGFTVIAFPMTENSQYLLFDVILDPESENLMFWAQHCKTISYTPSDIVITDTAGNVYQVHATGGRSVQIPESEKDYGVNGYLDYKWEKICTLDRALEAPIAKVQISEMHITFGDIHSVGTYTAVIPELGETVSSDHLPNGGMYVDTHGITLKFNSMYSNVDELNNKYEVVFTADYAEPDFEENITALKISPKYIENKNVTADFYKYKGGSSFTHYDGNTGLSEAKLSKGIIGYGDKEIDSNVLDLTFGDEIIMRIGDLHMTIAGEWLIDFTEPAKTAE